MRRRLLTPMLVLVLAAPAGAQTGGAEAGAAKPGYAQAAQDGLSVTTRTSGLVGVRKTFTGTARPGQVVTIERFDEIAGGWAAITRATTAADGTFRARWKPDRSGSARVRARLEGPDARSAAAAPELAITVYTAARATWYGPGFYGRQTACGVKMSKTLVGVAHKKLPCGTKVTFLFKGRTVTAPVVDRGPFANGAKWDLTYAASEMLGFTSTGVGTVGRLVQGPASR